MILEELKKKRLRDSMIEHCKRARQEDGTIFLHLSSLPLGFWYRSKL